MSEPLITLAGTERCIARLKSLGEADSPTTWLLRGERDRILGIHRVNQTKLVGGSPQHNAYLTGWGVIEKEIVDGKRPVRFLCDILVIDPDAKGQRIIGGNALDIDRLDRIDFNYQGHLIIREHSGRGFGVEYHVWTPKRFAKDPSSPELIVWTEAKLNIPETP